MIKNMLTRGLILIGLTCTGFAAAEKSQIGIVNFTTCITDSKYGKNEQNQLENIKNQWTSIIEQTEKELKEVMSKFEDQEYIDGLSPEAEDELKMKYKALSEDMAKYQNQLYQVLNQANYFFIQKMQNYIAKASESVASNKNFTVILNKEATFYSQKDLDITKLVINEMDKNYDTDVKNKKISENTTTEEKSDNSSTEVKK